jgi:hypothetical protein
MDVYAIKAHLASIAPSHSIILNGGCPISKGSAMLPEEAFALLAWEAAIQSNLVSLKTKMLSEEIYIWTKGAIENHLGGIPKNEMGWANFNAKLETEDLNVILPTDHTVSGNYSRTVNKNTYDNNPRIKTEFNFRLE